MLSLAGLIGRAAGTVTIDGTELSAGHPRRAAKQGVVLVPDDRSLFTTLTTTENLRLAATSREKVGEVLDLFPRLKERLKVPAGVLSGGEQQMLAIGRALVQDPKVLLIDELSMGLAPVIVESLLPILRTVAQTGVAVVLVEQHVSLALRTADRALVLAHGEEVLAGSADELLADPARIEAAYMGGRRTRPDAHSGRRQRPLTGPSYHAPSTAASTATRRCANTQRSPSRTTTSRYLPQ
ncbi:ABC transporter ATP-binding protein [Gordonia humi]|uniref:ABC transporter ATP-binding protein n=1 Tax=Gordonia humi TaxID=686429 RepID=UPI003619DED6